MNGNIEKSVTDLFNDYLELSKKIKLQEELIEKLEEKIKIQEDYIESLRDKIRYL